jgi:membrane protease YdiL (CAAX protease family)
MGGASVQSHSRRDIRENSGDSFMVTTEARPQSVSATNELITSPWHTLLVLGVGAFNAYRGAMNAAQLRAGLASSRPRMYLRTMFFEFVLLAIVVIGVRLRSRSLQPIFGERWRSAGQVFRQLGIGVALLLASTVVASILGGGHQRGAQPDHAIGYLMPQSSLELLIWMALSLTAGICEEAVFRGYLQRQFSALTRSVPAGILIAAAAFGGAHAYQGLGRAVVIGVSGVLFGVVARWSGTVRPGMVAHTLQDAIAPFLIKLVRH